MTCEISYQEDSVYQAIIIEAESAEIATAYFHSYQPDAQVNGQDQPQPRSGAVQIIYQS